MENTCLWSFYEYIMKNWMQTGRELPELSEIANWGSEDSNSLLCKRKEQVWNQTRKVLSLELETKQKELLEGLCEKEIDCGLCLSCQQCEKLYWKQIKAAILLHLGDEEYEKPELLIPDEINRLFEQKDKPVDIYLEYYKRRTFNESNFLLMLKGFSSSTPILLNYAKQTNFYSGGGFFIRWNGKGIVVDPGYLFVQNLHNYGLSVLDIDVVIVTHEHIDHSSDMRLLDDLHFNVARSLKEKETLWSDEDFSFSRKKVQEHKISWYLDSISYRETLNLSSKQSGFSKSHNDIYCIVRDVDEIQSLKNEGIIEAALIVNDSIKITDDVIMHVFSTRHEQYKDGNEKRFYKHTFGCMFECKRKIGKSRYVGYTSDTSIHDEVYENMHNQLKQSNIIVSNISGVYKTDVQMKKMKERHLGYFGCFKLVYDILMEEKNQLKYLFLSEFSNQVSDIRYSVSRYMQSEINKAIEHNNKERLVVVPTEVGLFLDLDSLSVKCTACGNCSEKMYIVRPFGENKEIKYLCSNCVYTNDD